MFSEDVVGLVEEMGFQPSSELSLTDGCWATLATLQKQQVMNIQNLMLFVDCIT